jgi:hypothetical protein
MNFGGIVTFRILAPEQVASIGSPRKIAIHLVPNVVAPFLILLTAFVGQAILAEASLSYLGLGVQEPVLAWGLMLQGGAEEYANQEIRSVSRNDFPPWLFNATMPARSLPARQNFGQCDLLHTDPQASRRIITYCQKANP